MAGRLVSSKASAFINQYTPHAADKIPDARQIDVPVIIIFLFFLISMVTIQPNEKNRHGRLTRHYQARARIASRGDCPFFQAVSAME